MNHERTSRPIIILSFLAIYVIWGSTYLAIRIAVESLPPFSLTAFRFLVAGALLYIGARLLGAAAPRWLHWKGAIPVGLGLGALGNGLVVYAEQRVPSAYAACIIPAVPMWLTLLNWMFGERRAPHLLSLLGICFGFAGVLLLSSHSLALTELHVRVFDIALVFIATISWAGASVYSLTVPAPASPLMATAIQMLCGGVFLVVFSIFTGELQSIDPSRWTAVSILALGYLTVFGSIIAFTAYSYLLRSVSPYVLGSYAFVNPIVAIGFGYWWYDEPLSRETFYAAGLILLGVLLMLLGNYCTTTRNPSPCT